MTTYLKGATVPCEVTVLDDGSPATPSDLTLEILDPDLNVVETIAMGSLTVEGTGLYSYDYLIPVDADYGNWGYIFTATISGEITKYVYYFTVEALDTGLYCTVEDVYRHSGVDSSVKPESVILDEIRETGGLLDEYFGRSFLPNQSATEWIDIENLDEDDVIDTIFLMGRPIQSIVSIKSYDREGTLVKTWDSSEYKLDAGIGMVRLRNSSFEQQNDRVEVVYTHGYDSVPVSIRSLCGIVAAMRVVIGQIGGTFDDVTSYSLPSGVSIGVGEPYTNMREVITRLEKERDLLIKDIGQLRDRMLVV